MKPFKFLSRKYWRKRGEVINAMKLQDNFFLENREKWVADKSLVVFCVPEKTAISGGILSIFNIAKTSRLFNENVVIATVPAKRTYARNLTFRNDEIVYRFVQFLDIADKLDSLIVHIPEYAVEMFYNNLTQKQRVKLAQVKNLQINIMNQNIDLMPDVSVVNKLREFTNNVTQTIGHHAYATQEICDKYQTPVTLVPAYIDLSTYKPTAWKDKENLIAYSNDENEYKEAVLAKIREELPEYKLIEINKMTFDEYMETITRAKFTITFGEGFDAYLCQPFYVGSIGVGVYNDRFFPSKDWLGLENVFESYQDLLDNFENFVKNAEMNITEINRHFLEYNDNLYSWDDYKKRIESFYKKNYSYKL